MTLESPSRVRSYEEEQRKEGREQTDEELSVFSGEEEGSPQSLDSGGKPAICPLVVPPPGAEGTRVGLYASRVGATHRSRDVRARRSLAVGPGGGGAPDFLLFPQQLPVLLLPVLHVDQQRDEAVLHLDTETPFRAKLTCADDGDVRWRNDAEE